MPPGLFRLSFFDFLCSHEAASRGTGVDKVANSAGMGPGGGPGAFDTLTRLVHHAARRSDPGQRDPDGRVDFMDARPCRPVCPSG